MARRCVALVYDACLDAWWFCCEPVVSIDARCLMSWIACLDGSVREFVPVRILTLLCDVNTMGWTQVCVFVVSSRPKVWTFQRPAIHNIVFDLGFPVGWLPSDLWPSVPVHVRFRWELALGSIVDEIDMSATIRIWGRPYRTHMPPAALRADWRVLAAPISSPCTPEQREMVVETDLDRA